MLNNEKKDSLKECEIIRIQAETDMHKIGKVSFITLAIIGLGSSGAVQTSRWTRVWRKAFTSFSPTTRKERTFTFR